MPNTPNYSLFYPAPSDRPSAFPAAQKTSQETLDTLLKQINDGYPAGDAATLNSAKAYADQKVAGANYATPDEVSAAAANALSSAKTYTDQRTPHVTIDTSAGTCVRVGGVIVGGSTGLRNITSLVEDATGGQVLVSRGASLVELTLVNLMLSDTTGWAPLLTLPSGFRPLAPAAEAALIPSSGVSGVLSVRRADGRIDINRLGPNVRHKLTFTYLTGDPWPSAPLPGNAA